MRSRQEQNQNRNSTSPGSQSRAKQEKRVRDANLRHEQAKVDRNGRNGNSGCQLLLSVVGGWPCRRREIRDIRGSTTSSKQEFRQAGGFTTTARASAASGTCPVRHGQEATRAARERERESRDRKSDEASEEAGRPVKHWQP